MAKDNTSQLIGYEHLVALEKPKLNTISPDGAQIAYVVQAADLDENQEFDTGYIWNKENNSTSSFIKLDKIKMMIWKNKTLYVLGLQRQNHTILKIENNSVNILITFSNPISTFTVTSDEKTLYYSKTICTSDQVVKKMQEEGYVYQWGADNLLTITGKKYKQYECEEIFHFDIKTSNNYLLHKLSYKDWLPTESMISALQLSSNENYLLISKHRLGKSELGEVGFSRDVIIFNISEKKSHTIFFDHLTSKITPCWISESELIFQEADYGKNHFSFWIWNAENDSAIPLDIHFEKDHINALTWNAKTKLLFAEGEKESYHVSLTSREILPVKLPKSIFQKQYLESSLSWDDEKKFLSAIFEDVDTPPQVVIYDIQQDKITPVSNLNKHIKDFVFGKIEPFEVKLTEEVSSNGYLLHPINKIEEKQYPLIIATYGFKGNKFAANVEEWHSTFPAQVLAQEGYYVLLLNDISSYSQTYLNQHERVREEEGWQMLKVFEHAVNLLNEQGLIDSTKVGLYGWSHGAFMVEFLIAHSKKFHVACIGEGGDYNPGCFWSYGMRLWTKILDNAFGGPPWGNTLKNYMEFSPFFQVEKIKMPLLMEFSDAAVAGLEMYVPLRYLNVPAELVIYDNEEHVFVKPKSRIASMARKVNWFNYWFFDKRDVSKPDQYERWDKMRYSFSK